MMFRCADVARAGSAARFDVRWGGRGARAADRSGKAAARRSDAARIDIHCHYHVVEAEPLVAALKPLEYAPAHIYATAFTREVNAKQAADRREMLTSVERRLADMDRMGIDIQAVSPSPSQYFYWAPADLCVETSRLINDRVAAIVAEHPRRFVGIGTVPLQNVDLAIAELERCVKDLDLRGIEINSNVNGANLTDPALGLERFFRRVQDLGVLIFIHPWAFSHGERLTEHYFSNVIGMPLESTIAVGQLIFDGVMARNPKLKVVVAHAGGYIAHYHGRFDHVFRARPDGRVAITRKPSTYLRRFYFDTITFDAPMLRNLIDTWGADHVLLGTDYPYDMAETDPVGFVQSVPRLTREDARRIMGGNAARLLKLGKRR